MTSKVDGLGLYIHIPFCRTKCNYCDFNTYAGIEPLMPAYRDALVREIKGWARAVGEDWRISTIFFGGGTPSLPPVEQTARTLDAIRGGFQVSRGAEITLESNPGDLTPALLAGLLRAGVNRLSIGVQSLHDRHLAMLTRRHSADEAARAFTLAKEAGFTNINLDLMYGLPRQSLDEWKDTLKKAIQLGPEHLSLYALTLEEGTPLWRDVVRGVIARPDDDLAADMYLYSEMALDSVGYHHYEVSNWARPGYECRHNLVYWRNHSYIGMGAGAHSYFGGYRFSGQRDPRRYIESVLQNKGHGTRVASAPVLSEEIVRSIAPVDYIELIDLPLEMAETIMLGLRLGEGVSASDFQARFGRDLRQAYSQEIRELTEAGLLEWSNQRLRLTQRGRLLGNEAFSRFVSAPVS